MDAVDRLFALVDKKYREQKDFAAEIGVVPQRVSQWKKRTSKSYTKYLPQITAALNTTAEYILTGQGVVSSSLATRTKKACNRNGYRLFLFFTKWKKNEKK